MGVRIVTARELKGDAWAAKYPDKANDLWVLAYAGGQRKRVHIGPDTPKNRECAERKRDVWSEALNPTGRATQGIVPPTFEPIAAEYLERGLVSNTSNTRITRKYQVRKLIGYLGALRLDHISVRDVSRVWDHYVRQGGRSTRTGEHLLDALSCVFRFAAIEGVEVVNPVPTAKTRLRLSYAKTADHRGRDDENCRPLSAPELVALAGSADEHAKGRDRIAILLLIDAGLRLGEVLGLEWRDLAFGDEERDTMRHLFIRHSLSLTGERGTTKTGRARRVGMSRRLRQQLLLWRVESGRRSGAVVDIRDRQGFRRRLAKIARSARIRRAVVPKDLRDSFASHLVTAGIPLKYVAQQIGDSVATTDRHYGRWLDDQGYRNPLLVAEGELPCDLLAAAILGDRKSATKYATKRHHGRKS